MASGFIEEIKQFEPQLDSSSWGAQWEVRTKVVTCIFSIFGVVYIQAPLILLLLFFGVMAALMSIGFRFKYVVSKLVMLIPFLLLMSVPILFSSGLHIDQAKFEFVLNLNLTALTAALFMMIMLLTQPLHQLLNGLSRLGIPKALTIIVMLAIQYTRLFGRTLMAYQKALISRLFRPSLKAQSFKVYSAVMAGLILRSIDQSEKVFKAMKARGFRGEIPTVTPKPIEKRDLFISGFFLAVIIIFIFIEKRWF
ncbi:energy-coupling factor transporter transmembrane component T family protein [Caldalkalibacillus uzonensis]|uniref:energy-coupling factor transporter transmembrane component T family protein n=1 Tax=Caldalkalibacillus uzonensis TaxID=353224 RepID=UPI0027D78B56|nr:energy-coupling factor transporter transmembrane component T [Caldalkalibacillus uzonensis]